MPFIAKQIFRLIHYFGYSKVAAYNEANSCTSDTTKWLFLSVDSCTADLFVCVCFLTYCSPFTPLRTGEGRRLYRHMKFRRCLCVFDGNKCQFNNFWLKFSPLFLYCVHDQLHRFYVNVLHDELYRFYVHVLVIV